MGMNAFAWPFIRLILTYQFYGLAFYFHKLVTDFIHLKYIQGTYHILFITLLKGLRPCKGFSGQTNANTIKVMQQNCLDLKRGQDHITVLKKLKDR